MNFILKKTLIEREMFNWVKETIQEENFLFFFFREKTFGVKTPKNSIQTISYPKEPMKDIHFASYRLAVDPGIA